MEHLKVFTNKDLAQLTNYRSGELKFGEKVHLVPAEQTISEFLSNTEAKFVLFGIPEDIGVCANGGRKGAASCWKDTVKSLVNIQHNKFCKGSNLTILGYLDFKNEMAIAENLKISDPEQRNQMYNLVSTIDKEVCHLVSLIIKAGKIPIIIGGGHNNSYGNIKGAALAKGQQINAINFDAHSDFRALEGRHSGNGFSYAYCEGFLKKYFVFGLHENYNSKAIMETFRKNEDTMQFNTYEEIKIRRSKSYSQELDDALAFIADDFFGIEVDLDSLPGIASSAMTPTGFSIEDARRFIDYFGRNENSIYLHIAEGAPDLAEENSKHLVGKLIAYLITDFMKSKSDL